jgi:hypothetical protein
MRFICTLIAATHGTVKTPEYMVRRRPARMLLAFSRKVCATSSAVWDGGGGGTIPAMTQKPTKNNTVNNGPLHVQALCIVVFTSILTARDGPLSLKCLIFLVTTVTVMASSSDFFIPRTTLIIDVHDVLSLGTAQCSRLNECPCRGVRHWMASES